MSHDKEPVKLEYPSSLVADIQGASGEGVLLPSESSLRLLLDVAFFTSLEREENRSLEFALAFVSPESIEDRGHSEFSALIFDTPIALSIREIVKLAPALDHRLASIGVTETQSGLQIWGLFRHGSREYEGLEGRQPISEGIGFDYLKVSCLRPGRLDIDIGDSRIASFVRGKVERTGTRIFVDEGPVRELLRQAAKRQGDYGYPGIVQQIVWTIRASSHGGTLIILPDNETKHLRLGKYEVAPQSRATRDVRDHDRELWKAFKESSAQRKRIEKAAHAQDLIALRRALPDFSAPKSIWVEQHAFKDAIRFFASLANVDGALVLGPDLRILGFGAMIEWSKDTGDKLRVHVARSASGDVAESIEVGELGGARHQSAAHFCQQRPGAIAFVISQDGGVSCIYNDGRLLRVWRDVRLDRRESPIAPEALPETEGQP